MYIRKYNWCLLAFRAVQAFLTIKAVQLFVGPTRKKYGHTTPYRLLRTSADAFPNGKPNEKTA